MTAPSNSSDKLDRREFLKKASRTVAGVTLAAGGLQPLTAWARSRLDTQDDQHYDFLMPRVKFSCDSRVGDIWSAYPGADRNLLQAFSSVVRCKVKLPPKCNGMHPHLGTEDQFNAVVDFTDLDELRRYPFLFMTAEGSFDLSDNKKDNLKRYIQEGGFLLMDDCVFNQSGDFFYQSSFRLLEEVFGREAVRHVPKGHEVFHNVYDLEQTGFPYMQGVNHGARGIFIDDRLAVFLSSTDIHCGWVRFSIIPPRTSELCLQMGVNIIMYALTH